MSIRVRPLSKAEAAKGSPWKLGPNSIALCNNSGAPISGQAYKFDKVFGSETSTLEIYETHTKDIIASAVRGFNGTVFAYGQTSSGKTYTMRGNSSEPGIIPLAVQEIFKNIQEAEDREFLLRVSYMEIYNEEINDLLAPENRKLQVHENIERGIFVAGLREEIVVSPEQVLDLMTAGENYRHVGETNMNAYSSRSHSIFRMVIESRDRSHDDPADPGTVQSCDAVRVSVLNLVDLAGSERVAKTGAEGARLKEGTHINKSLMTLGTVINKLSEGVEKQGGHVPYRDSKLTRILQPALGGNAKTAVICNITPAQIHVDETKGTLFFASRANRVTNCAQVNEIMTDAALLKRQKKEIEELRSKLRENHSEHWDAEILNLRNALLKTELDRERMALELQEEKKAQIERERRLKEQEQKIESLSTMVINSAVDDRDIDRRNKKNNRRETWCPRIPSIETSGEVQEIKRPFAKESPFEKSTLSTRRDRLPPMPPPFQSLLEDEDKVSPFMELDENIFVDRFQSIQSASCNLESIFQEPPPVFFCERKRRSSQTSMEDDLRQQLGDLQAQYENLQLEHEMKMREKVLEMEDLKKEMAFMHSAANKARKLDNASHEAEDRRGRSLDGSDSFATVSHLRAQIQVLEMEKIYMQRELDSVKEQSIAQADSSSSTIHKLEQELEEAKSNAANTTKELNLALHQIDHLQNDQQTNIEQQAALVAFFNELTVEVETTKSSSQALYTAAADTKTAFNAIIKDLQESVIDMKSLRSAAEIQQCGSVQSKLEVIMKEHESLFSSLQIVQKERDAFSELSKSAQADLKSLEAEISGKSNALQATESNLLAANQKIVDAGNEIAELQSVVVQHERQQQALEQKIRDLESESMGAISKEQKEKLEERIAELEQELALVSQERANLISKGEAMHATIQVLEGERDALIETSKQAQADMDRLHGKRRQELKEAQNQLDTALSETHLVKEQLILLRSLLTEKTEEQQAVQLKLENLQCEATSTSKSLEESVQALHTQLTQKRIEFESSRREYEELAVRYEALNKEKSELIEACSRSEEECNCLRTEFERQGLALAEAEKRLESGRALHAKDEKQLIELHQARLNQNIEVEALNLKIANLTAEKCAMETCLAGQGSESINSVLVEKSVQLSAAECALKTNMAELAEVKRERELVQEFKVTLETELAESRSYSMALEETLSEAVNALEVTNQEKLNLKAELEKALKESTLKSAKLADIESECAALVESMGNIKLEMENAKIAWEQEVQNQKDSIKLADVEQAGLVEERNSLRSALSDLEEQYFQAQTELKKVDIEVQSQRQEIEAGVRALEAAEIERVRAAEKVADLQDTVSRTNDEKKILQTKIEELVVNTSFLENTLEKKFREFELAKELEGTLTFSLKGAQQQLACMEMLLQEKSEKTQVLSKDLLNLEAEYSSLREDLNSKVVDLHRVEGERDGLLRVIQELNEESKQLKHLRSDEESQLEEAKLKISAANSSILGLQDLLVKKTAELEQVQQEKDDLVHQMTKEQTRTEELEALLSQKSSALELAEQEKNELIERMIVAQHSHRDELERKIQDLQAVVSNLEAVNLKLEENLKQVGCHLNECVEDKERLGKEKEALLSSTIQLQDMISCLKQEGELHQVELKQMEDRLAAANSELDGAGQQLNEVHTLLAENQKERLLLQQSLEELENFKAGLQKSLSAKDTELASKAEALSEIKTKFEVLQQLHNTESCQLKSDILGLRKELKAAKSAPASLEKERDGLRKDLEKVKTKLGDIEAKLKTTLIEKSKVETEKLNVEREVKQLRQSTALLNKRESIVDKRRESVACGLNKTKLQLSSTEHALQMKTNELEKTAFDLQLLQDNYSKLEADMAEIESSSIKLKEKLVEAENVISVLRDGKETATATITKMAQDLSDELEAKRAAVAQHDALQNEHTILIQKVKTLQVACEETEAKLNSISLERDDLARQLTDAHFEFEEEKAAWSSKADANNTKVQDLQQDILNLTEQLQEVQKAQEELVIARNSLQKQLDEVEQTASATHAALQDQVYNLKHCLESSEHESQQLRQQVELLNSTVEEQVELKGKLEKEQEEVKEELQKLEVLLAAAESTIEKERQSIVELVEKTENLNRMVQEAEQNCASLNERNSELEAAYMKESDERVQVMEERRSLLETVQSQAERCIALEGQISRLESSLVVGREDNSRLLQEIEDLKQELRNNMEVAAQDCESKHHALDLEASWNNDREVAKKQVEKLQTQLNLSHAEIESLQTEVDDLSMKVKSLYLEVDDMQSALDQSRTEKSTLKQQLADLTTRLGSLEDKNEQLQKNELHLLQLNKAYLTSKTKLQFALDATISRCEHFQSLCEKMEEAITELDEHKTATRRENDGLQAKIQSLRSRCQRYEEELRVAKSKRSSPEEEQERANQLAEIMQQNSELQLRLHNVEGSAKARRKEITQLNEIVKKKEQSSIKLEAALEKAQGQVLKLERDLYLKLEPQTARKVEETTISTGEFTTPVASRQGEDDGNHTDDTTTLYSNTLASRSKVEQLKLQSQSLLRMYKQPWRIQGPPGGSMDETNDHPPPSTTLQSHHENLTAPIPTWKRVKTGAASSATDFSQPSNSVFNEEKGKVSSFTTRSVPRAALVPVTQNKLQALQLKRRLQESGSQDKPLVLGIEDAETKPSLSNLHKSRNFRLNQRFEKENL